VNTELNAEFGKEWRTILDALVILPGGNPRGRRRFGSRRIWECRQDLLDVATAILSLRFPPLKEHQYFAKFADHYAAR